MDEDGIQQQGAKGLGHGKRRKDCFQRSAQCCSFKRGKKPYYTILHQVTMAVLENVDSFHNLEVMDI